MVLTQLQTVGTQRFYLEPDVIERSEAKALFHQGRVFRNALDGIALYEETVAHVLEIAIQFILFEVFHPDDRT